MKIAIGTLCLLSYCCPALALCPSGYQQTESYQSQEFRLRWSGSGDYSTCLSLDYPKRNNARGSYAVGYGTSRYKCGDIILGSVYLGNTSALPVQPSDPSLAPVSFEMNWRDSPTRTRKWCESGNPVTCYRESVYPQTFSSKYTSRKIEGEHVFRNVSMCKLVTF